MQKSIVTQNLVNNYPEWSKVRNNDQSVGYQFINALAKPIEKLNQQLTTMEKNAFLTTCNLDEIDIIYKIDLATDYEFQLDTSDVLNPVPVVPTVEGLIDDTYYPLTIAPKNNIENFWYNAVPNRASIENIVLGEEYVLSTLDSSTITWSGELNHHLADYKNGDKVWIEVANGSQYIRKNEEKNIIERASIVLTGITRKGTEESETFVFGWDIKQPSWKQWKRLTKIDLADFEDNVTIQIRSGDFASGPYWSFWNNRYSDQKTKIDEFWDINTESLTSTFLERIGHVSTNWQDLVQGFSDTEVKESWELLDSNSNNVVLLDITVQPFKNLIWGIDANGTLYCYSLIEETISDFNLLSERTNGADAQLYVENKHIVLGDNIVFQAQHLRITQEIASYELWYQDPNGTVYNVTSGATVPSETSRYLSNEVTITPTIRGEWLIGLDVTFLDGTTCNDRVIVSVQYKTPLVELDLSELISLTGTETYYGIDFDADQKLWICTKDDNNVKNYYQINLHSDMMLIDYNNKVIYVKESYDSIRVT